MSDKQINIWVSKIEQSRDACTYWCIYSANIYAFWSAKDEYFIKKSGTQGVREGYDPQISTRL